MNIIKNPARSRPLSANVRRLMKMARESPYNPDVEKVTRTFNQRDLAYCDMQGSIFMAAVDRGVTMTDFSPLFMLSQLAGVIDHSFSVAGGMESDDIANLLHMPMLLKSPEVIVDVVIWLNNIVSQKSEDASANMAVVKACVDEGTLEIPIAGLSTPVTEEPDIEALADEYEYAYWLGYIYRYECLLHDESSRMVYGAFNEAFMRKTYEQMFSGESSERILLSECAAEICRRLDDLLIGKLWK